MFFAIIADDEPLARERVRSILQDESDVQIVAECADGSQALRETQKHQPDLLFLDVQMPRLNGFEVLEGLSPGPMPVVIFTTAHDEHAIRAFEFNALDYLLKPFTEARLKKSLQRARAQLVKGSGQAADPKLKALLGQLQAPLAGGGRILVRSAERILFLKPEEIDRVEAAGNYVVLHSGKTQHIIRETISAMEARLAPAGFMRISRSVIVNLTGIREIQPAGSGRYSLLLKNGTRLDMTCSLGELQGRLGEV
ncbi:MAG TPA: LytTR family DNA-binding domain-containing protein [Candidatus Saccharimonadales bacterium]|nr:LytTR family DNA-binding domain-containing protein [Candidatus Saccharimonadales bacterium]